MMRPGYPIPLPHLDVYASLDLVGAEVCFTPFTLISIVFVSSVVLPQLSVHLIFVVNDFTRNMSVFGFLGLLEDPQSKSGV